MTADILAARHDINCALIARYIAACGSAQAHLIALWDEHTLGEERRKKEKKRDE